jgi:hypothetical protein
MYYVIPVNSAVSWWYSCRWKPVEISFHPIITMEIVFPGWRWIPTAHQNLRFQSTQSTECRLETNRLVSVWCCVVIVYLISLLVRPSYYLISDRLDTLTF